MSTESVGREADRAAWAAGGRQGDQVALLVDDHLRLDESIGEQLRAVSHDTEASAVALIEGVGALSAAATALLGLLGSSELSAGAMGAGADRGSASIVEIGNFVEELPDLLKTSVGGVHDAAVKEIGGLDVFVKVIVEITEQTKVLAINASIMASTVGRAGQAFKVIAAEVRSLSERSAKAATMIAAGLEAARAAMAEQLRRTHVDAQISKARRLVERVREAQAAYEDIRQYYKAHFEAVTEHNTKLAREISEILGQVQQQDVVRQRLERVLVGMSQRNEVLRDLPRALRDPSADLSVLATQMHAVLEGYVAGEKRHAAVPADNLAAPSKALPRIELF